MTGAVASSAPLSIVVVGAGGVGGYFGGRLARAGVPVTFLARGAHLDALRARGLTVRSAVEGEWTVPVDAVAALDGRGPADVVLLREIRDELRARKGD